MKYFTCAETAKLVRKALKEAFPGVKFGVRSSTYSGGASISVQWIDGPNEAQVNDVAGKFKGAYFDSMIDYQGSVYHMMDGLQVRMGADYIHLRRDYSDGSVGRAIATVYRKFRHHFDAEGIPCPTIERFQRGELWGVRLPRLHSTGLESVQHEVNAILWKHSDRLRVCKSATASSVFVTHDDGYSVQVGAGITAVPHDSL